MEENWLVNVEYDSSGKILIAEKFQNYREKVISLSKTVEHHFNNVMHEMSQGLPSVVEE